MQQITNGYLSLELLFEVNNDRLISALIIGAALAAVGWVGVEYAQSFMVQDMAVVSPTFL